MTHSLLRTVSLFLLVGAATWVPRTAAQDGFPIAPGTGLTPEAAAKAIATRRAHNETRFMYISAPRTHFLE